MKVFTKEAAAAYLGISLSKLLHHKYKSGLFPRGQLNEFGVLVWTKAELDSFKPVNAAIKRGFNPKTGAKTISPRKFRRANKPGVLITYKGRRVVTCERGFNFIKEYELTFEDGQTIYVRDNVRLHIEAANHENIP